jgi:RNA polymerase sigma-70 factor (ECF subfamily)
MEATLINESNLLTSSTCATNLDKCSDETLVAAAKGGSRTAFEQLIERYQERVFCVARRLAQSREDAEEITQDAFVLAFKSLTSFRGASRFYTWLVRITINVGLMRLRRHHPLIISIDDQVENEGDWPVLELEDSRATPERWYLQQELQEILVTTIGQLPSVYRSVFELREVQGFSTEETAQALDLSRTAVKSRLRRARVQMRQSLTLRFNDAQGKHSHFRRTYRADSDLPGHCNTTKFGGGDEYNKGRIL